jgi:hypothetical protein
VTAGSFVALVVLFGLVAVGVVVSDAAGVLAALVASSALVSFRLRLWRLRVGVASATTAGGCTDAAVACASLAAALRAKVSSSSGRFVAAWEGVGAGPIAAPTATPTPSIAAASAAVTRADGARKGDFWVSGVLFIEWSEKLVKDETF